VACWKKVNIWDKLERPMQQAESFSQFFTNIRRLDQSQLVTFVMIAWSIWRKRNTKLWDDKNEIVESHAQSVLCAWQQARHHRSNHGSTTQHYAEP
jgi:hypothetical protein